MSERGKYIVAEGPDGSGKSTIARHITDNLNSRGIAVHQTREPGGTPIAEALRHLVLSPDYIPHFNAEIAMFTAGRADLWHNLILPKLESGISVVSDRNYMSSEVYQGDARGFGADKVVAVTKLLVGDEYMNPDLTLVLIPANHCQGVERVDGRGAKDRIEQEAEEFQRIVYEGYMKRSTQMGRIAIDASKPLEIVKMTALKKVLQLFEDK